MDTRSRTNIDDMVGGEHCIRIVLNNDDRVSKVAEMFKSSDKFFVIALMKADAGFVKDIENSHKGRTNLGRKADSLCFATGKGRCVS